MNLVNNGRILFVSLTACNSMFNFKFMTSLLNRESQLNAETPENFLENFEKNLNILSFSEVDLIMKQLQYLGINFDPFNTDLSNECQTIMDNLGLTTHFRNPYLATNILLRLLDKTEERLYNLKQ